MEILFSKHILFDTLSKTLLSNQTMNRRTSIKNLLVATGGLIALPAWAENWSASGLAHLPSSLSPTNLEILAYVADTIIPVGNSIGALSVGVDKFLDKLIANCYEKEIQDNVARQLEGLDLKAKKVNGVSFKECSQMQREALLIGLSTSENKEEKDFFDLMKSQTIRGFNTSREVMLQYLNYKIVPGHFYGCVDVNA
jgi:hypothetical protein